MNAEFPQVGKVVVASTAGDKRWKTARWTHVPSPCVARGHFGGRSVLESQCGKKRWNQSSWLNKIELFDKLQHDLCCVCGGWRWQIYVYVLQYVSICYYAVYILSNISKKFRWHHQVKRRLQRHSWAVHGCCATCALDHTEDAAGSSFGKMVRKLWWDDTLWHIISQILGDSFVGEWLCTRDLRVFVKGYITLADSMGIDDQWHCLWSDNQHPGFWSVQSVILWEGKWLLRVDGSFRHTLQTKLRPSLHGEWCGKENSQFHLMFHSSAAKVCRTGGLLHGSHRRLVPRYGIAGSNGRRLL